MIPEGSFIEVNDDFKFHYYDEGDGDVVVLLHGSGTGASGHTNFKNNFSALRDAGFRVILPDLPGYGFSSKPDNEIYSLQYFNKKITHRHRWHLRPWLVGVAAAAHHSGEGEHGAGLFWLDFCRVFRWELHWRCCCC